jgi:hypothetical protein
MLSWSSLGMLTFLTAVGLDGVTVRVVLQRVP